MDQNLPFNVLLLPTIRRAVDPVKLNKSPINLRLPTNQYKFYSQLERRLRHLVHKSPSVLASFLSGAKCAWNSIVVATPNVIETMAQIRSAVVSWHTLIDVIEVTDLKARRLPKRLTVYVMKLEHGVPEMNIDLVNPTPGDVMHAIYTADASRKILSGHACYAIQGLQDYLLSTERQVLDDAMRIQARFKLAYGTSTMPLEMMYVHAEITELIPWCARKTPTTRLLDDLTVTSVKSGDGVISCESPTPFEAALTDQAAAIASENGVCFLMLEGEGMRLSIVGPYIKIGTAVPISPEFMENYELISTHHSRYIDVACMMGLTLNVVGYTPPPRRNPVPPKLLEFMRRGALDDLLVIIAEKGFGKTYWSKALASHGYIILDSDTYGRFLRFASTNARSEPIDAFLSLTPVEREQYVPIYDDLVIEYGTMPNDPWRYCQTDAFQSSLVRFAKEWTELEKSQDRVAFMRRYLERVRKGTCAPDYAMEYVDEDSGMIIFAHCVSEVELAMKPIIVRAFTNHDPYAGVIYRSLKSTDRSTAEAWLALMYMFLGALPKPRYSMHEIVRWLYESAYVRTTG